MPLQNLKKCWLHLYRCSCNPTIISSTIKLKHFMIKIEHLEFTHVLFQSSFFLPLVFSSFLHALLIMPFLPPTSGYQDSTVAFLHLNQLIATCPKLPLISTPASASEPATSVQPHFHLPFGTSSSSSTLPLLPHDAVATTTALQHCSAVRELTAHLQLSKPRHPKRPQLPPGETCSVTKSIAHSVVYKQKLANYNTALINYDRYLDELLYNQSHDLNNFASNLSAFANQINSNPPISQL